MGQHTRPGTGLKNGIEPRIVRHAPAARQAEDATMDERRLIDIEEKVAHHEQALAEMNQILTDQQAQLTRLEHRCEALTDRFEALSRVESMPSDGDERPPHY